MPKIAMIFLVVALIGVSLGPTCGEEPQAQDELIRERIRSMSIFSDADARKVTENPYIFKNINLKI